MTILSKLFSRERSLFYFCLWNDSDRLGFLKWAGYGIKNNLFLRSGKENKVTVCYNSQELDRMLGAIAKKVRTDKKAMEKWKKALAKEWGILKPYVDGEKTVQSVKEFKAYYKSLVAWWSVMAVVWYVPDLKNISEKIKKEALSERIATEKYSPEFNKIFERFFLKKFPQYKKYIQVIKPTEVFKLQNRKFSLKEINEFSDRLKGYGLLNGKIYIKSRLDKALSERGLKIEQEEIKSTDIIKGVVASAGIAKGKVKLLLDKKLIGKFKKGGILVTEMTDPDYLPAMKKAGAVITDEGGIACHAAIVARELKKPCVIGTKNATKILKDGMTVEVDANKGVVKILKK